MRFEVEFFELDNGKCPIADFLNGLNTKLRSKTVKMISLLEQNGTDLRMPYSKMLNDGIFELRCKQGSDITRILYFFYVGQRIVLTNGFIKKTNKTPLHQIETAKKYRDIYLERQNGGK